MRLHRSYLAIVLAPSCCPAGLAAADGLDDAAFSLRLPAAISRFSLYADVAASGDAQAASRWASSVNPASAAWPRDGSAYVVSVAPQFTAIRFDSGTDILVSSEAVEFHLSNRNDILIAAAQIHSNEARDRDGLIFSLDADYVQLQWGFAASRDRAIGVAFDITDSDAQFGHDGVSVAHASGTSYEVRLGVLHQPSAHVRLGAVLDYGIGPSHTRLLDPSFGEVSVRDTTEHVLLRSGLDWDYATGCDLYLDYQLGVFSDGSGTLRLHRFFLGVDHSAVPNVLFLRAGTIVGLEGRPAVTMGVGISLGSHCSLDLAYQYDMFPEVGREFGNSQTFTISVGISF